MRNVGYEETIDWYNQNASSYAEKSMEHSSTDKQQLDDFSLRIPSGGKVLDAGCGSGRDTGLFNEKGFKVTGLDISRNLLEEAKKRYKGIDFVEGDMLKLPFKDNTFDATWAHAAIVHFEEDGQVKMALSELHRTLKSGGVVHILVRAKKKDDSKTEVITDSISKSDRFYRNFTAEEMTNLMSDIGFTDIEISQYNESDMDANKRPGEDIEWLLVLAKKS